MIRNKLERRRYNRKHGPAGQRRSTARRAKFPVAWCGCRATSDHVIACSDEHADAGPVCYPSPHGQHSVEAPTEGTPCAFCGWASPVVEEA